MTGSEDIARAIDAKSETFGKPGARKSGRNPRWPYVPIITHTNDVGRESTQQIPGLAYETREAATARAEQEIAAYRERIARQLGEKRFRALREQFGLPRETETPDEITGRMQARTTTTRRPWPAEPPTEES